MDIRVNVSLVSSKAYRRSYATFILGTALQTVARSDSFGGGPLDVHRKTT